MDETPQYLLEFRSEGERQYEPCATVDVALALIRSRAETGQFDCELWQRVPFSVNVDVQLGGATRRTRKGSPASGQPSETTPAAETAPKAGDVRSSAAAVTPPAIAPPAPTSSPARPSCGGKACETRADGKEVHRPDASCSKFATTKKLAAR